MYLFKIKDEYKNKVYWNNPKYKLANLENIIKCFESYDNKRYNLNWTDERHFWLNLSVPYHLNISSRNTVISSNKYFLISQSKKLNDILENKNINWNILYVNSFSYLNQQQTILKLNFEIDNFFSLLKYNSNGLNINGLLSRTTLPKYTYYRSIENRKTIITISPNVLLHEDMQVSPFLLNKITTLFKYNKKNDDDETESLDNLYFYLEPNKISLKQEDNGDIKNNIIRKPLFISNNFTPKLQPDNLYYFDGEYFFLNNNITKTKINYLEYRVLNKVVERFNNEKFLIILPVLYSGSYSYYMDLFNPYSLLYPNTYIYRRLKEAQDGTGPTIYNSIYNNLSLTNRYIILTYNNIYLGYDTDIVAFSQYKTVPNLLNNNLHFYKSSNYSYEEDDFTYQYVDDSELINPYLSYHNEVTSAPEIKDDIYFDHPEKKVKAGFMNASESEINGLFKTLFSNIILKNTSIKNIFDKYLPRWKQFLIISMESLHIYIKQNINYLNQYYYFITNKSHNWKEYLTTIKTQYKQRFILPERPLYDPKLIISKQFTNYVILSPNTRQEIDLDLYFNRTRTYYTSDGILFNYHYSETEFYDAGYSILSYPFYQKNFVTKYLKNDTILSNAHIEHLKTNINSINFQKQQESITLARAYQDRYLGWINNGLNLLTLGFQYKTNNSLPNPVYNAIGTNILAQNAFYAANSIINTTINANRGIEDSKRAITKWYATQNDLYLQNKVDQNILGIESSIELKEESCSLYYQSLSENELKKANYFFNKWGWKVNEYITNISFTNFYNNINRNISFDYIEMEDVDFIPELTTSENIYLQDVLKMGIWLIYDLEFTPLLFHENRSPIELTSPSPDAEKAVY